MEKHIFVVNPGSTSTKFSYFINEEEKIHANIFHDSSILLSYPTLNEQLPYRMEVIFDYLEKQNLNIEKVDAIIVRGGSCYPLEGGVYAVDDCLYNDIKNNVGKTDHPSNLGVQIGRELQKKWGGLLLTADPIMVDEYSDLARMTGVKGLYRKSHMHVLNARGTARKYAREHNEVYEENNYIVAHIDGGITVSAHHHGKMIDGTDGTGGEGAYTPSRVGSLSSRDMLEYAKGKDEDQIDHLFIRSGGFTSHFNTSDSDKIHRWMLEGNKEAERVWKGMVYNVAKVIGGLSTVLKGDVSAIILTGGLMRFQDIEEMITEMCGFIAPIAVYPNEVEQEVLAYYALEVLNGNRKCQKYTGKPVWNGFED